MRRVAPFVLSVAVLTACSAGAEEESASTTPTATVEAFSMSAQNTALNLGAQGYAIVNLADATSTVCPDAGCSDAATSDYLDILVFPDQAAADAFVSEQPDETDQRDLVVLRYTPLTTEDQRIAFPRALQSL